MDPIFEHFAVHVSIGAIVRTGVLASALRYFMRYWPPWHEVLAASLSPVFLRALLGEATFLTWGTRPVVAQVVATSAVVLLQFVTIRLATDHERDKVSIAIVMLITLIAQLSAHLVSGPLSRALLGEL